MKPDLLRVIEAAYANPGGEEEWLSDIAKAAQPALDNGLGVAAFTYSVDPSTKPQLRTLVQRGGGGITKQLTEDAIRDAPFEVAWGAFAINRVSTLTEFFSSPNLGPAPFISERFGPIGFQDSIGVVSVDPSGHGIVLSAGLPEPRRISPAFRRTWSRVLVHLAAGLRLRTANRAGAEPADAVLDAAGKLHDASGPARDRSAREALRQAARAIDRARSTREREPAEAVELWRALVVARWSLVDWFDSDGRHFLIARRNALHAPPLRELSEAEAQVTALAALGRSNKLIAYELGVAVGTVGTLLSRAMRKLGLSSRAKLIEYWQREAGNGA